MEKLKRKTEKKPLGTVYTVRKGRFMSDGQSVYVLSYNSFNILESSLFFYMPVISTRVHSRGEWMIIPAVRGSQFSCCLKPGRRVS